MDLPPPPSPYNSPTEEELRAHVELVLKFLHERRFYGQEKIFRKLLDVKIGHPPSEVGQGDRIRPKRLYRRSLDEFYPLSDGDTEALRKTFGSLQVSLRTFYSGGPPEGYNFTIFIGDDLEPCFFPWLQSRED